MVPDTFVYTEPEQLRADLLSMASHELRTPLTVLKLQAQFLNRRLARQGLYDYVVILTQMEEQIQKMERLNGDLLNVSTIQTGRFAYVEERVDLNKVLQESAGVMQQMHPTHTVVVRGTATSCVVGDRVRLDQVFSNLLSKISSRVLSYFDLAGKSGDLTVFAYVQPGIEGVGQVILTAVGSARFLRHETVCRSANQQPSSRYLEKIAAIEFKEMAQLWDCVMLAQFGVRK